MSKATIHILTVGSNHFSFTSPAPLRREYKAGHDIYHEEPPVAGGYRNLQIRQENEKIIVPDKKSSPSEG